MQRQFLEAGRWKKDAAFAVACALFGLLLSTLPHLIWWARTGQPVWLADNDDLLYLSIAGRAYLNHPFELRDPASGGPTIYPWLQLGPGIVVARMLDLGPAGVNLVWRMWAGASIGVAWYALARHFIRWRALALGLSLLLLADVGVLYGKPLMRHLQVAVELMRGGSELLTSHPQIHLQWRIITPGLSLAFLILHLWLTARARDEPTRARLAWSGIGFGLLFYAYFYYFTAAGLGLVLAFALDAGRRRTYFHTAWIGGLVGLPSVVSGFLLKQTTLPDWQHRTDNFLPIPRFSELLIPKGAILLLLLMVGWVWFRRRDLLYPWSLAAAALILENHQIVTGLQIQNFHWSYVWGAVIFVLLVLIAAPVLQPVLTRSNAAVAVALSLLGVHLAGAVWMRWVEATQTAESVALTNAYHGYQAQRLARAELVDDAGVAGEQRFVDLALVLESQRPVEHYSVTLSPAVADSEWDQRVALNGFLRGLDRDEFAREQDRLLRDRHWGPWGRTDEARGVKLASMLRAYDAVAADPAAAWTRFRVGYVALPAGAPHPTYLDDGWQRLQPGPTWQLWRRSDLAGAQRAADRS